MAKLNFKTMDINDIIEWCKANDKVDWLKAKASEKRDFKVYPKVAYTDENGKTKYKADKKAEPTIESRPISFIQIKKDFVNEFMPEIAPKAEKKPTMYDLIAKL